MTRLSFAQARELGIDERIIREAEQHTEQMGAVSKFLDVEIKAEPPKPKRAKPADGYDSKLERDFAEMLKRAEREQWIRQWWHHPCGFRLAPKCYYHPDFLVDPCRYADYDPNRGFTSRDDRRLIFIEIKGGWWCEHTKVKTKVCPEMYPCFRWFVVFREKHHDWDVREITSRGIGCEPIHVPWIQ